MSVSKIDQQTADRVMRRACDKVVRLYRDGADLADVTPVLDAAQIAADVLLEER